MKKLFKKQPQIDNMSPWRIISYFIIYSVIGFFIETIFGIITKGVWESRQSFLYGPFCGIYGLGAVVMILFFYRLPKEKSTLFVGGFFVGSITEYIINYAGEMMLGVKWWDYSDRAFNVNGRICLLYSIFWGILAVYLLKYFNPIIDKLLDYIEAKLQQHFLRTVLAVATVIICLDFLISMYAVNVFQVRMIVEHNINVSNIDKINGEYELVYGNIKFANFIYKFWGDEKMLKTYPNLKVKDLDGNMVYFDSFRPDIQTYYHKFK